MAIGTPRGKANSKTSGTTLVIPSFTVPAGHSLTVGAVYANDALAPTSVVHAGRDLRRKVQEDNTTRSIHNSGWIKGEYHKEQTGTCVLTWSSAIVERAAVATSWDRPQAKEASSGRSETTATTSSGTANTGSLVTAGSFVIGTEYEIVTVGTTNFTLIGAASNTVGLLFVATDVGTGAGDAREALTVSDALAVCYFGSEGPVEDHGSVTAKIEDGGILQEATIGQKEGTTGGGAASNITIIETYLQLTTRNPTRGRIQNATSRRWVNTLLVLKKRATFNTQGITPSDIVTVEDIVEIAGGDVNDIYFGFNEATGEWEAYETTTPSTLRATRSNTNGEWSTP